jgi:hypothetical protein
VVSFTPRPFYSQEKSPWYPSDGDCVGSRAVLDAVVKRKIPSPHRRVQIMKFIMYLLPVFVMSCFLGPNITPEFCSPSLSVSVFPE